MHEPYTLCSSKFQPFKLSPTVQGQQDMPTAIYENLLRKTIFPKPICEPFTPDNIP